MIKLLKMRNYRFSLLLMLVVLTSCASKRETFKQNVKVDSQLTQTDKHEAFKQFLLDQNINVSVKKTKTTKKYDKEGNVNEITDEDVDVVFNKDTSADLSSVDYSTSSYEDRLNKDEKTSTKTKKSSKSSLWLIGVLCGVLIMVSLWMLFLKLRK